MTELKTKLKYFKYEHLSDDLQAVSKPFHDLAKIFISSAEECYGVDLYQLDIGLQKLLEAKDQIVRAHVHRDPNRSCDGDPFIWINGVRHLVWRGFITWYELGTTAMQDGTLPGVDHTRKDPPEDVIIEVVSDQKLYNRLSFPKKFEVKGGEEFIVKLPEEIPVAIT